MSPPIVLAITGASGAVYAVRLLELLVQSGRHVHLTISPAGRDVMREELQLEVALDDFEMTTLLPQAAGVDRVRYHHYQDFRAPIASGSSLSSGMVICPCSGGTLGAIAAGAGNNLIHRAAEVHLKEQRKLILVPRETPLSLIHIENLKRLAESGATILPAAPGWYHGVHSIRDLVDFVVARILDQLSIEHTLLHRWGSEPSP
jgi:4-hydroxy-3-polyprenylbenzoate decarboxylase